MCWVVPTWEEVVLALRMEGQRHMRRGSCPSMVTPQCLILAGLLRADPVCPAVSHQLSWVDAGPPFNGKVKGISPDPLVPTGRAPPKAAELTLTGLL